MVISNEKRERMSISNFLSPYKKKISLSVFYVFFSGVCNIAVFIIVAKLLGFIFEGGTIGIIQMSVYAFLIFLLHFAKAGFLYRGMDHSHVVAFSILASIRKTFTDKFLRIALGDVQKRGYGEIKKNFVDDIEDLEKLIAHMIPEGIGNTAILLISTITMFAVNYKLALSTLAIVPVGIVAMIIMVSISTKKLSTYYASSKNMNDNIVEYINGMEVIKVFNQTGSSYEKYSRSIKDFRKFYWNWAKPGLPFKSIYKVILTSPLLFALPLGFLMYGNGEIGLESLVLSIMLALCIGDPLLTLLNFVSAIAMTKEKSKNIISILNEDELYRAENPKEPKGCAISITDLSFAYDDKWVLNDISLNFKKGSLNALVGESGAGKSTLARLLVRLWDYQEGDIKIGGVSIKDISFDRLMNLVSYVSQDNFLFNLSIKNNIKIGNENATDEEVINAAQIAQCHEFITKLPHGYDTIVSASGSTLSGGERQRITIARAIIKTADIIVLDEATSFTDPENEDRLQTALSGLIQGKLVVVIAHRLSSVVDADQIVVLEKGKIHAKGTHGELIEESPVYKKLWDAHEQAAIWNIR